MFERIKEAIVPLTFEVLMVFNIHNYQEVSYRYELICHDSINHRFSRYEICVAMQVSQEGHSMEMYLPVFHAIL